MRPVPLSCLRVNRLSIPLWCDWDQRLAPVPWPVQQPFQSHCGAIGTCRAMPPSSYIAITFNPTVVRLGPAPCRRHPWASRGFQSHCGAIGTQDAGRASRQPHQPFNPTVVRLGPALLHGAPHHVGQPFNPTVVRLGPSGAAAEGDEGRAFQSHCGAIGTTLRGIPGAPASPFQSHCGAIGTAVTATTYPEELQAFNPTVVRLGPDHPGPWRHRQGPFQSHCGAIGTRAATPAWGPSPPLSIPLWCDWDRWPLSRHGRHRSLSIPLWCDWDQLATYTALLPEATFNPTVVRLGPLSGRAAPSPRPQLSIPLWCDWDIIDW